ncbi:MAG: type IV secretory system conjugative DNA transfer family protein [Gaiellaceae bacterium]
MRGVDGILTALVLVGVLTGAVLAAGLRLRRAEPSERGIVIGRTPGRRAREVALSEDEMQHGVLLGGSPGAGKTTLLVAMATGLPCGVGLLVVDLKGDRSLADRLGIPADRVFGLADRGTATWNPFDFGSPASWRDILMATEEWSEPHFRRAAARFLGALLGALHVARDAVRLEEVVAMLERPSMAAGLLRAVDGRPRDALQRALGAVGADPTLRSGVVGLGNRLALLADSPATAGRLGAPGGIDLAEILRGGRALFSLPAAEYPDEAPAIAAAAIQALGAAGQSLARGDENLRAVLVIDEAPRLGGEQLREAVAIGRGAGIGATIAVQDFADLDYIAKGTREAVETGANTWIVMRQVASAGQIAEALGTRQTTKSTVQHDRNRLLFTETGLESVREVEEFRVSPNVIRDLGRGEAIVWRRLRGRIDRVVTRRSKSMWE